MEINHEMEIALALTCTDQHRALLYYNNNARPLLGLLREAQG